MPNFVISPPPAVAIPVAGGGSFPVRRVYCIGRNYADHVVEMGGDPNRESPFFFQKNPNNLDSSGEFPYPPHSTDVHHEVELVIALKSGGTNIPVARALDHVWGYAPSLDMTRRDLQNQAKKAGRPWEVSKAFERSGPVGLLQPAAKVGHLSQGRIEVKVNGVVKQSGDINQMIWKVPEMIAYLSEYFELAPGDIIFSGTPSGVGPVSRGDIMEVHVDGLEDFSVKVV